MAEFYDTEPLDGDMQMGSGHVWGGFDGDALLITYGVSPGSGTQMPNGQTELRLDRAAVDRFLAGAPKADPAGAPASSSSPVAPAGGQYIPPASPPFGAPPNG